jgi:hypothetical protein
MHLADVFRQPLHGRPLIQCQCGQVLRDAACQRLDCDGIHAPSEVWAMCGVCKGETAEASAGGRGQEGRP